MNNYSNWTEYLNLLIDIYILIFSLIMYTKYVYKLYTFAQRGSECPYEWILLSSATWQVSTQIFPASTGGGQKMAEDMNVPFLGSLPLDPRIGKAFIQFAKTSAVVFKMNYM